LIFAVLAGIIGTLFSILIRTELAFPGQQIFAGDYQFYNVIITGHAFIMIVRHCVLYLDVLIYNICILILYIMSWTYLKEKFNKGQEHVQILVFAKQPGI
jgi:heme/copper-type cytochrome/quinol oxidase subunit 1